MDKSNKIKIILENLKGVKVEKNINRAFLALYWMLFYFFPSSLKSTGNGGSFSWLSLLSQFLP